MPYRLKPGIHLVCVKDRLGKVCYHYANPVHGSQAFGPFIPWISDEQAAHLLRIGYVERVDEEPDPVLNEAIRDGIDPDRVRDCIQAIAKLDIPTDVGAPKIRAALRTAGHHFGNDVVGAAVKTRKALLSPTAQPQ